MAAKKTKEKDIAYNLFVYTDLSQKNIAEKVGVSERTIGTWLEEGNWEDIKTSRQSTDSEIIANLKETLKKVSAKGREKADEGTYTKNDADAIRELTTSIKELEGAIDLRTYIQVLEEFMDFIPANEKKSRESLAGFQSVFLLHKAKKLI